MTKELSDHQIDELLRDDFEGAVSDDGFSARVMRVIPTHQRQAWWQRRWPMPVAAGVGGLLTWLALLPSPLWRWAAQEWIARDLGSSSASLFALLLGLGMLCCFWALDEAA